MLTSFCTISENIRPTTILTFLLQQNIRQTSYKKIQKSCLQLFHKNSLKWKKKTKFMLINIKYYSGKMLIPLYSMQMLILANNLILNQKFTYNSCIQLPLETCPQKSTPVRKKNVPYIQSTLNFHTSFQILEPYKQK